MADTAGIEAAPGRLMRSPRSCSWAENEPAPRRGTLRAVLKRELRSRFHSGPQEKTRDEPAPIELASRRLQSRSQWRRRRSLHTAARPRASCKALIVLQRRSLVQPARAVRLSPRHDRKHHNTRLSAASGWCAKSRRAVSELKPLKRPLARLPSKRRGSPPQPPPPRLGRPPPLAFANPATAKVGHPRPPQAPGRRSGLALRTRS